MDFELWSNQNIFETTKILVRSNSTPGILIDAVRNILLHLRPNTAPNITATIQMRVQNLVTVSSKLFFRFRSVIIIIITTAVRSVTRYPNQ